MLAVITVSTKNSKLVLFSSPSVGRDERKENRYSKQLNSGVLYKRNLKTTVFVVHCKTGIVKKNKIFIFLQNFRFGCLCRASNCKSAKDLLCSVDRNSLQ